MNLNNQGRRERLECLEDKHKRLDKHIKQCYTNRADDIPLNRLKTEKLRLKDEIHNMTIGLSKWKENTHQAK
jgi:uncharacterized protein YdcH (DUF465 family)